MTPKEHLDKKKANEDPGEDVFSAGAVEANAIVALLHCLWRTFDRPSCC
jgi:hypothetical protein